MKPIAFFLLALLPPCARAEELLSFSTIDLVVQARYVVEVRPLRITWIDAYNHYGLFEVLQTLKGAPDELKDTIRVHLDYTYDWTDNDTDGCKALLFLLPREQQTPSQGYYPVSSGIRLLRKNGQIYGLIQSENPGPFRFCRATDYPSWDSLLTRTRGHVERERAVRTLLRTEPFYERNALIFNWIKQHIHWFTPFPGFSWEQDDLGMLRWDLFNSIINSGIPADAWKAIRLFHELYPEEQYMIPDGQPLFSNEQVEPPFARPDGVLFLLDILADTARTLFERQQAQRHLSDALQTDPPGWAPYNRQAVRRIIGATLPYLKPGSAQRHAAFWALSGMASPTAPSVKRLLKKRLFPALEAIYRVEAQGELQNALGVYLATRLPEKAWQALSGNPAGLCIVLQEQSFDTAHGVLRFRFRYAHGQEPMCSVPDLFLESASGEKRTLPLNKLSPACNLCGPRRTFEQFMEIPLPGLASGRWRMYCRGAAGPAQEYSWQSNTLEWELPEKE